MRQVDPLLGTCSLTELRQRKSVKWREYPPEVLPSFVADMDFSLAEPIIAAVTAALALGDSGYAHPGQLADAFAQFAADRLGWAPETAHIYPIQEEAVHRMASVL
jgi:cystathionine beta-lyase